MVVMTGDLPPHDLWKETRESARQAHKFVADELQSSLDIPVHMAIGNHENYMANAYP